MRQQFAGRLQSSIVCRTQTGGRARKKTDAGPSIGFLTRACWVVCIYLRRPDPKLPGNLSLESSRSMSFPRLAGNTDLISPENLDK